LTLSQSLFVLPCLLSFLIFFRIFLRAAYGRRMSFLIAATLWGFAVTLSTEALSPSHLTTRNWLAVFWIIVCVLSLIRLRFGRAIFPQPTSPQGELFIQLSAIDRVLLGAICTILTVTAFTAIVAPPNTDDGMEYHLPRVVLWASNHTVQFFPVFDFAQILHTPWAEYAALHLYLLQGSDRLFNLIEWFAFVGCVISASLIAQYFGAGCRGQIVAAVLCVTLPELILESTGPNNTAVAAFWIAAAVVFLLFGGAAPSPLFVFLSAVAIGLAVLTKGTTMVLLPGLLLAVLIIVRPKLNWPTLLRIFALLFVAILLNAPKFLENYRFTGHALGLPYQEAGVRLALRSESHAPAAVVSGVLRNAALHLSVPSAKVNALTQESVRSIIRAMGSDPDDPRTTWRDKFIVPSFTTREYFAGFPGQFALFLILLPWALFRWHRVPRSALWMLVGICASFVVFSATVKWQPSSARYQLPLFVVATASLGTFLLILVGRKASAWVALLALLGSLPFVFDNGLRSLIPVDRTSVFRNSRNALYFMDDYRQDNWAAYEETAEETKRSGCKEIGIDAQLQSYVYPVVPLIRERVPEAQFQYIGVENPTKQFVFPMHRPIPCVVVCLGCMRTSAKWDQYKSFGNRASIFGNDNVVFWPGGTESNGDSGNSENLSLTPVQLADRSDMELRDFLAQAEFSKLAQYHELDSPFQDAHGALLRARRDAAYELRMRATRFWEESESSRTRARSGTATPEDMHTLRTLDEAYSQLRELLKLRDQSFQRALVPEFGHGP
jgi:hypothetical protein